MMNEDRASTLDQDLTSSPSDAALRSEPSPKGNPGFETNVAEKHPLKDRNLTGDILKKARLDAGVSLGEASEQTKIKESFLTAIEDGVYDDLPATSYAVGFVKIYADTLGLDAAQLAAQFRTEMESPDAALRTGKIALHPSHQQTSTPTTTKENNAQMPQSAGPQLLALTAMAGVCILAVWAFLSLASSGTNQFENTQGDIETAIAQADTTAQDISAVVNNSQIEISIDAQSSAIILPDPDSTAAQTDQKTASSLASEMTAPKEISPVSGPSLEVTDTSELTPTAQPIDTTDILPALEIVEPSLKSETTPTTESAVSEKSNLPPPPVTQIPAEQPGIETADTETLDLETLGPENLGVEKLGLENPGLEGLDPESETAIAAPLAATPSTSETNAPIDLNLTYSSDEKSQDGPILEEAAPENTETIATPQPIIRNIAANEAPIPNQSSNSTDSQTGTQTDTQTDIQAGMIASDKQVSDKQVNDKEVSEKEAKAISEAIDQLPLDTPSEPVKNKSENADKKTQEKISSEIIITPATLISTKAPVYPPLCSNRAKPVELVRIQFGISAIGNPVNPKVIESSNSCFNRSALKALKKWRYNPKLENGRPVNTTTKTATLKFDR